MAEVVETMEDLVTYTKNLGPGLICSSLSYIVFSTTLFSLQHLPHPSFEHWDNGKAVALEVSIGKNDSFCFTVSFMNAEDIGK